MNTPTHYQVQPVGCVRQTGDGAQIEIAPDYRPALKQLEHFSHVIVLWWAGEFDHEEARMLWLQSEPPYAPGVLTGVFACRAPYRPNPIALTTCKLRGVDETSGLVRIAAIDAFDGTAVLDLKPYFPVCDRVQDAHIPAWLADWPDWMPDEGLGLEG